MSTSRSNRRIIAQNTLDALEAGFYILSDGTTRSIQASQQAAEHQTLLYRPDALDVLLAQRGPSPARSTVYEVTSESTLQAIRRLLAEGKNEVLALNFASAKNPGGGFLGGSQAQEESLARSTGLYPCLLQAEEYYTLHRKTKSCFYTDHMIYSPRVPLLKDDEGTYLTELRVASFITSPAVNTGVVKRQEPERVGEIKDAMKQRMAKVLAVAEQHGHRHLVLGAWGCGVFQNEPAEIAQYFKEVLEGDFKGVFETIVFAVYAKNERFIRPFQQQFGH